MFLIKLGYPGARSHGNFLRTMLL